MVAKFETAAKLCLTICVLSGGAGMFASQTWAQTPSKAQSEKHRRLGEAAPEGSKPPESEAVDPLPPGAMMRLGTNRLRHAGGVRSLVYPSKNNDVLVSASEDGTVRLWDAKTGKELRRFEPDWSEDQIPQAKFFRYRPAIVVVSPDGKTVAALGNDWALDRNFAALSFETTITPFRLRFWDAETGRQISKIQFDGEPPHCCAFSPNGKNIAVLGSKLKLIDWKTGKHVSKMEGDTEAHDEIAFSQDGETIVACGVRLSPAAIDRDSLDPSKSYSALTSWNAETGKRLFHIKSQSSAFTLPRFTSDGKLLLTCDIEGFLDPNPKIRFFSFFSRGEVRDVMVRSRDPKTGKVVKADWKVGSTRARPLRYDMMGGAVSIQSKDYLVGKNISLSLDGRILAILDRFEKDESSIRLWNVGDQKEIGVVDRSFLDLNSPIPAGWDKVEKEFLQCQRATESMVFSPDGKTLACSSKMQHVIRLWDVASRNERFRTRGHPGPVRFLNYSSDGKRLTTVEAEEWGHRQRFHEVVNVWDISKRTSLLRFAGFGIFETGYQSGSALSADGARYATPCFSPLSLSEEEPTNDYEIRVWNISTGERIMMTGGTTEGGNGARIVSFSSAGKMLAVPHRRRDTTDPTKKILELLDIDKGRVITSFETEIGEDDRGELVAIAPDCSLVAWLLMPSDHLTIWDVKNGKKIHDLSLERDELMLDKLKFDSRPSCLSFSPDGKYLALGGDHIRLWEMSSGRLVDRFGAMEVGTVAFSPDGHTLASTSRKGRHISWDSGFPGNLPGKEGIDVQLWELASRKQRASIHTRFGVRSMAFAPDSRTLATGENDSTVLFYDLGELPFLGRKAPIDPDAKELEEWWEKLASDDAAVAFEAISGFSHSPLKAVTFLKPRLPVAPPRQNDDKRLRQLLSDLENEDFTTREKASEELFKIGKDAEGALRNVLVSPQASLEIRRRIERILEKLHEQEYNLSAETLQFVRAVETLERIGSSEARDVLKELAKGAPNSRLTQDARAASERLARRQVP